jgi:hypothetical protein
MGIRLDRFRLLGLYGGGLLAFACSATEDGPSDPPAEVAWSTLACDPIAPAYCAHPFPSNVFTTADDTTATGRRVALSSEMMPVSYYGGTADPSAWAGLDGFSPGTPMHVHMPGASSAGLPTASTIERSLEPDSPTVLLDAETGELVAHFAELNAVASDPEKAELFIRPAARLREGARYIVAIRGVVDLGGDALPASAAFAALRDGTEMPGEDGIEDRRPLYTDIFSRLKDAGVERSDLQIAWDFTTASGDVLRDRLVSMRDTALGMVGTAGASFTITSVEEDWAPGIAFRVQGTFDVPMFLDQPGFGARLQLGADGLPTAATTHAFPFLLLVPESGAETPAPILQYGHGLLGTHREIEGDDLVAFAADHGFALLATDWIGLTTPDQPFVAVILESGVLEDYESMFAQLSQSVVNALVLMRTGTGGLASDPTFGAYLDPSQRYYYGISLGGIMGSLYLTLSADVERGVVDVMGAPFVTLLDRSRQFDRFFDIANAAYSDPRDVQLSLTLIQMLWDRVEPNGFLPHLSGNPLPGTPDHTVLMRVALGDHSVSNVGAEYMARTVGAPLVDQGTGDVFGLETISAPHVGTAMVRWDFGLPPIPDCPTPPTACTDPHGALRALDPADEQIDRFLRAGEVTVGCPGGVCSFPERGGCSEGAMESAMCLP